VKAEESRQRQAYQLKPAYAEKIQYGKRETKTAITNVLNAVLHTYKYSSLPALNAVLQQYNVIADRGNENSRVFKNNGLVYRILDANGNKTGVPVKASDFYNKPGLAYLETKFKLNETVRPSDKSRVKNTIDLALLTNPNHTIESLKNSIEKKGIHAVVRQNPDGIIYGITYVDHQTKCVFKGSDLGKEYSAKGLQERCQLVEKLQPNNELQQLAVKMSVAGTFPAKTEQIDVNTYATSSIVSKGLEDLLNPVYVNNNIPQELGKPKKKKRKQFKNRL